jgi:integrase
MTTAATPNGPQSVPSNEPAIARLPVPAEGEARYWSDAVSGLHLRIRTGGSRVWVYQYRDAAGVKRKITLGRSPAMTLRMAIDAARQNIARVAVGDDPAAARSAVKAKATTAVPMSLLFTEYLEHARQHVSDRYHAELTRYLNSGLTALHRLPAGDLTADTMAAAVGKVKGKIAQNRAKAALASSLKYAAGRGIVPAATYYAARLLPANAEAARDRVLSYAELALVWKAADPATGGGRAVRFLMLSGLRRDEAGGLHTDEIDRAERLVTIGADRMKGKVVHILPLTPRMEDLIGQRPGYVFGRTEAAPFSGWSKAKATLDAEVALLNGEEIEGWHLHDLRHSLSTHLNEQPDAKPDLIDRLLAHARKGSERNYNHAQLITAKRELLVSWDRILVGKGVIGPE